MELAPVITELKGQGLRPFNDVRGYNPQPVTGHCQSKLA